MMVAGVDAKMLGDAIAAGTPVDLACVIDGKSDAGDTGGYVPEIRFDQMDGVWQYSRRVGSDRAHRLCAKTLAIKGAGVDKPLPTEGMAACAAAVPGRSATSLSIRRDCTGRAAGR